eukprot:1183749-Prorocentrum_minimum.AAC.1
MWGHARLAPKVSARGGEGGVSRGHGRQSEGVRSGVRGRSGGMLGTENLDSIERAPATCQDAAETVAIYSQNLRSFIFDRPRILFLSKQFPCNYNHNYNYNCKEGRARELSGEK